MENNIKICQNCGTVNKPTSMFCKSCGNRIADVVPVPAPESVAKPVPEVTAETSAEPAEEQPAVPESSTPVAPISDPVQPSVPFTEYVAPTTNENSQTVLAAAVAPATENVPLTDTAVGQQPFTVPTPVIPVAEQPSVETPLSDYTAPELHQPPAQTFYNDPDYINGLSVKSVKAYMGCSSEKLYNKFVKHNSNSSVWNWPVFFFSLLGVPFVWFFYRRMYKVGAVVLAIWFALTAGSAVCNYLTVSSASDPVVSFVDNSLNLVENDLRVASGVSKQSDNAKTVMREFNKMLESFTTDFTTLLFLGLSAIVGIAQIIFVFVISAKANKLYFNRLIPTLRKMQTDGASEDEIRAAGGTNATAATVSGFLIGGLLQLVSAAPMLIFSIDFIPQIVSSVQRFMKNIGMTVR